MKELLHKFSILMLFLYITSVYVFSYNKELYMISNIIFVVLAGIFLDNRRYECHQMESYHDSYDRDCGDNNKSDY